MKAETISSVETCHSITHSLTGRGALVVRSHLRGRWVSGSNLYSNENPPCMLHAKSQIVAKRPPSDVERKCREMRYPHHLTAVQSYDVCPKIALVLLQNGSLI
ncbi:hypothetical protein AVEN_40423-1 [Araneus ventricosus]|uniref:Uncharacterized protein n=1 Tax=Araneus ventricosus TaxID=182803 RepID=A0A4Y2DBJ5_ARAVE|nr:hypothetical protein AVEN_40423-1 [Araneus ventricosus]